MIVLCSLFVLCAAGNVHAESFHDVTQDAPTQVSTKKAAVKKQRVILLKLVRFLGERVQLTLSDTESSRAGKENGLGALDQLTGPVASSASDLLALSTEFALAGTGSGRQFAALRAGVSVSSHKVQLNFKYRF